MGFQIVGPREWTGDRDENAYRKYQLTTLVEWIGPGPPGGPSQAMVTPGLPLPGSEWAINGDEDDWAFCTFKIEVNRASGVPKDEPCYLFEIVNHFDKDSCKDGKSSQVDNPLLEPMKVSGSFTKFTEEATTALNVIYLGGDGSQYPAPNQPNGTHTNVVNSAGEQMSGHKVEFDNNRPTVKIEQNVADLQLGLIASMVDTVNDATLWGIRRRCVKLANISWEKKYYHQCFAYYTRTFEFEIDYASFDRFVVDEGTKALNGEWNTVTREWDLLNINGHLPDPSNPSHFNRFKDPNGEFCKTLLDGTGKPYIPVVDVNKWWTICSGVGSSVTPEVVFGTCAYAVSRGLANLIFGPFDTQDEANAAGCPQTDDGNVYFTNLSTVINCPDILPGSDNGPGHVVVQKYAESDFMLLGIPLSF